MITDVRGCSACKAGQEQYETFTTRIGLKRVSRLQYDYRHTNGELFSTVAKNLSEVRKMRDAWIKEKGFSS